MIRVQRAFLVLFLLVVTLPVGLLIASPALAANCLVGTLASPDDEQPYSADYFTAQASVLPGSQVTIYLGAYAPSSVGQPRVSGVSVLDPGFTPIQGLAWSVPTSPDCTQSGRTMLYRLRATWKAPGAPGTYELAVTFTYDDGTLVEDFVNMTVSPVPHRLHGFVHWETTLKGLPQQNALNYAYNLYDPHSGNTITAETSFYFQRNPAAQRAAPGSPASTSVVNGGMGDNLNGTGNVFLLPQPEPVPYLGPRTHFARLPFAYTQGTGLGGQPETGMVTVETGHWTFGHVAYS